MAAFLLISGVVSSFVFALSSFDTEEKFDLKCDCIPFDLLSSAKESAEKRVPIEFFHYASNGDLIVEQKSSLAS